MSMSIIKLMSSDSEVFDVDVQVASCSKTIKSMLEDLDMEDGEQVVIPLPNVNAKILRKVIDWATRHKDDPPTPEDNEDRVDEDAGSWDADYVNVDLDTLFEIISAAHYLGIKGLLHLTCKTVANMLKGKKPEEIRNMLHVYLE